MEKNKPVKVAYLPLTQKEEINKEQPEHSSPDPEANIPADCSDSDQPKPPTMRIVSPHSEDQLDQEKNHATWMSMSFTPQ